MLRGTCLYGLDAPQFVFVRATRQDVLHVPESPIPLNSPEFFVKSPFKFNAPLPPGDVVRDIIFDQDRFYSEIVKRFQKKTKRDISSSRHLQRNNSTLYELATTKPLRIATQSFIYDEMEDGIDQRIGDGEFSCTSFCPSSPNFDSQHSILDLTHVSRSKTVYGSDLYLCMGMTAIVSIRNIINLCRHFVDIMHDLCL